MYCKVVFSGHYVGIKRYLSFKPGIKIGNTNVLASEIFLKRDKYVTIGKRLMVLQTLPGMCLLFASILS